MVIKTMEQTAKFKVFDISIELTNKGLADVNVLLRIIFEYINLILTAGITPAIYSELTTISLLDFVFGKPGLDPMSFATEMA